MLKYFWKFPVPSISLGKQTEGSGSRNQSTIKAVFPSLSKEKFLVKNMMGLEIRDTVNLYDEL